MRLKSVVLPEPFGPISPVIVPAETVKEQSSTATTPPKCFDRPSTSRSALTGLRPSSAAPARAGGAVLAASAHVRERRQDPPRQQEHDHEEHPGVADEVELARAEPVGEVLLRGHEDERADHRAPERALAAEVDHQHHPDRDERVDRELRVDEREVVGPDSSDHARDPGAEREGEHLRARRPARRSRAPGPRRRGSRTGGARAGCRVRTSDASIAMQSEPSIA